MQLSFQALYTSEKDYFQIVKNTDMWKIYIIYEQNEMIRLEGAIADLSEIHSILLRINYYYYYY